MSPSTLASTVEQANAVRVARDRLEAAGFDVEGYGGDGVRAILDVANERDADLIVLAGRKRTPTVLFGTTQSVTLDTERPMLVCNAEEN